MSVPIRPTPPTLTDQCPICGARANYRSETEVLEQYADGVGQPCDPRRVVLTPSRQMVPGRILEVWEPCGHRRWAD